MEPGEAQPLVLVIAHDSLDDWSGGLTAGMVVQDTELFFCSPCMAPEAP